MSVLKEPIFVGYGKLGDIWPLPFPHLLNVVGVRRQTLLQTNEQSALVVKAETI